MAFYCKNRKVAKTGGNGLFHLIFPGNRLLLREIRAGTQAGHRNIEAGADAEETLLAGILLKTCSTCFLSALRTTSPKVAQLIVAWILP